MASKYFYVKNSLGTRTTGGGLAKQTGTFTALGAASVYASDAAVLADSAPPVAGDFVLHSNVDAFTQASALTTVYPDGVFVLSVSDTALDTYASGASVATTGASALSLNNGNTYIKGVSYSAASGASNGSINLATSAGGKTQIYESCNFILNTTHSTPRIFLGASPSVAGNKYRLLNCTAQFGNAAQGFAIKNSSVYFSNLSITSGSTAITGGLFESVSHGLGWKLEVEGADLTNLGSAAPLVDVTYSPIFARLCNIKLPISWTGTLTTGTIASGNRVEAYNLDSGNTNYKFWIEDYQGTIREETTLYLSAGLVIGATHVAWKFTTNANTSLAAGGLVSQVRHALISSTGSKTITCELLTDGQLTDQDVAMDVVYLGDASYPDASFATTQSDPLTTAANLSAGAGTSAWNSTAGLTTPTSSKLTKTLTFNQTGIAMVTIRVMKPSITLYADAKLTVA